MKYYLVLWFSSVFIFTFLFYPVGYAADTVMSVKLVNYIGNKQSLNISITGEYDLNSNDSLKNGEYQLKKEGSQLILYQGLNKVVSSPTIILTPMVYNEDHQIRIFDRPYLGTIELVVEGDSIRPINHIPMEDYLKGVVPREMPALWNIEAVKAQAIAARNYAMNQGTKVINDTVSYQVYGGYNWHPNSTKAVEETEGQYLVYNNRPISTVYSSSNGGMIESNGNAWNTHSLPYLITKEDPYDPATPWEINLQKKQIDVLDFDLTSPEQWWSSAKEKDVQIIEMIKKWLQNNGYENKELKIIEIPTLSFSDDRTSGKRAKTGSIAIEFFVKEKDTNIYVRNENNEVKRHIVEFNDTVASRIRAIIGPGIMKSYYVDQQTETEDNYFIKGFGFGHGVGMSQWGAKEMADQGFSYDEILSFYYPGATVNNQTDSENKESENQNKREEKKLPEQNPLELSGIFLDYDDRKDEIKVGYKVNQEAKVTISILDSTKEKIENIVESEKKKKGRHLHEWNSSSTDDGTYTVEITAETTSAHAKSIAEVTVKKREPVEMRLTLDKEKVQSNGKDIELLASPHLRQNRTMVPIRFISEQLGAKVTWNQNDQSVAIQSSIARDLFLRNKSKFVMVDGEYREIDVAPTIIKGTTFVPLRFIAEHLQINVTWNQKDKSITLKN